MVAYDDSGYRMPRSHLDAIEGHARAKADQQRGFFEAMRKSHPIKVGDVIEGKRVVMTCWEWTPNGGDKPIFQLAGETKTRTVS